MIKKFYEWINTDNFKDIEFIVDILHNITDIKFEYKITEYDANKYFRYLMDKKTNAPVLVLWTLEEIDEEELLNGIAQYQNKLKDLSGFHIHRISFLDDLTLLTFRYCAYNSPEDTITMAGSISIKLFQDLFQDNPEVMLRLRKEMFNIPHYNNSIGRVSARGSDFYSMSLSSGIDYKNGDSSNLSLWQWRPKT